MSTKKLLTDLPEGIYKIHIEPKLTRGDRTRLLATSKQFTMSPTERKKYKQLLEDLKQWATKTNDYIFHNVKGGPTQQQIQTIRKEEYNKIVKPFLKDLSSEDRTKLRELDPSGLHRVVNEIHFRRPFDFYDTPGDITEFNTLVNSITRKELKYILATAYMSNLEDIQTEYEYLDHDDDTLKIIAYELNARIMLSDYYGYDQQVQELTDTLQKKLNDVNFENAKNKVLIKYIKDILDTKPPHITDMFIDMVKDTINRNMRT